MWRAAIDLDALNEDVSHGRGITQCNLPRIPIDLELFLVSDHHKRMILDHLAINYEVEI